MKPIYVSDQQYARLHTALMQAIASITQRGLALIEGSPARLAPFTDQPFITYLPALAFDLQTSAFHQLLTVTRQLFEGPLEPFPLESLELARFNFWQCLQDANNQLDWKHPLRVARNAVTIGYEMGWPQNRLLDLHWGALMHDVGKIFVEELEVRLEGQEYDPFVILAFIRTHATLGSLFMSTIQPLFPLGEVCASQHQESIDGSGYPKGLRYGQISTEGIIVGLSDSYDATVTRSGWSANRVCNEELEAYQKAGYPGAPELTSFLSVVRQYHSVWYP